MSNTSRDIKKSNFTQQTTIPSGATFDFVYNGANYKISYADMVASFGTVGTISQLGLSTATPILNIDGTDNQIRNIEDGPGVKASVSSHGGVKVEHNFTQGTTGAQILKNSTETQPIFRTILQGSGISVAEQNGYIQIALSATPVTTKTIIVNEEADFPAAVSGVITLEANTEYYMTNDITTSSRFVLGSSTVLTGSDGTLITLTYSGTGIMFTSVNNSNKIKDVIVSCTSGTFCAVSCASCQSVFQVVNTRVLCDTIGTIDGIYTASFQNIIWGVVTDGLTFLNNNSIISFFQNIGTLTAGTFVDLGTSTFDGFTFSNSQGELPAGTILISGAADSGNVNSGGFATVINTRATGLGTPLSGITTSDSLWEFFANNGITDSINSLLATNAGNTVTIAALNTPVIIGATWVSSHESRFEGTAGGRFTYTGKGAHVAISATITAELDGTPTDRNCTFYIFKNGTEVTSSGIQRKLVTGSPGNLSLVWQEDLATNDYLEIFVENNESTEDVIINSAILGISG